MGGEKIKFIAYAVIAVFVISIAYFVGSIYIDFKDGPQRAQTEFEVLSEAANRLLSSSTLIDEEYIVNFQNVVLGNSRIVAVLLSVENEIQFAYPVSSPLIIMDGSGMPNLHVSSPLLKTFSSAISTQQGKIVVIKAAVYLLQPKDIYDSARISFLIILACTLIILILLVYTTTSSNTHTETLVDAQAEYSYIQPKTAEPAIEIIPISFRNPTESSYSFPEVDVEVEKSEVNEYEFNFDDKKPPIDIKSSDEEKKDFVEKIIPNSQNESILSDPMGLFSNVTGVGWESYMETRLDAELVRAASSEQDLTLMFVRIKDIDENKLLLKEAATILLDYFKFKDFVFEYKKDGFSGILLNINLDQAMVVAESLYAKLVILMREGGITTKIGIGLSTRTLRLIPGSRIITEATEAIEKSFSENDLPIVAFKVNPEKYRQFILDPAK